MATTAEERSAKAAIEDAIERYREAFRKAHPESTHGTLTDWILVAAEIKPNMEDPDEDFVAYSIVTNNLPWYRARGLMEAGIQFMNGVEETDA